MDRPLTRGEKWFLAVVGAWLALGTVVSIGLIPKQSAVHQFTAVLIGAVVGLAVALPGLAIQPRLERSDRWMGRPRFVDFLGLFVLIYFMMHLDGWLIDRYDAQSGEFFLGFLDGLMIAFVIRRLRGAARPPGTSLPA